MSISLEELSLLEEQLEEKYPFVNFKGEKVKFYPLKYELEKGEIAEYLDSKDGKIKLGVIEGVNHSNPMDYPFYSINGAQICRRFVWPKVDEKGNILSYKNKINKNEKDFIKNLKKSLKNKPNLSAQDNSYLNLKSIDFLGMTESYSEFGLPQDDRDNDPIY